MSRFEDLKKKRNNQTAEKKEETQVSNSRYQSLKKNRTERNYGVDDAFVSTFVQDTQNFLKQSQSDMDSLSWESARDKERNKSRNDTVSDLRSRSATIRAFLNANKSRLDKSTYEELASYIEDVDSATGSVFRTFYDAEKMYSHYDSQKAYDDAVAKQKEYFNKWGKYSKEADYDEYSQMGASIKNPTYDDAQYNAVIGPWKWGNEDVGNIVTFSREHWQDIANDIASDSYAGHIVGNYLYHYMTEDEVGIYNYLLAKEGNDAAQEYLDDLEEQLNFRQGTGMAKNILSIDNGFLRTVAAGGFGLSAGLDQAVSGTRQFFSGDKQPTSAMQYGNAKMAESLDGFGQYAYQATNVIGNMAPSILVSTLTGGLGAPAALAQGAGALTMGVSAAGNAYGQALADGYNKLQARTYSTLVGASEGLLQYLIGGIGQLGGVSTAKIMSKVAMIDNSLLRIAAKLGVEVGSEIIEEEVQNFLEPALRSIIFGEDYDAPTIDELIETAIVTALSTPLMSGGNTIVEDVASSQYYKSTYGDAQLDLVAEGLESPDGSLSKNLATKYQAKLDAGKDLSGHQLGRMVEANEEQFRAEDMANIQKAATDRLTELGETGNVEAIGAILAKQAAGQKLTKTEQQTIASSKYGQRVSNEMNTENISSGDYSSDWTGSLDTQRINAKEYSRLLQEAETAPDAPQAEQPEAGEEMTAQEGMATSAPKDVSVAAPKPQSVAVTKTDAVVNAAKKQGKTASIEDFAAAYGGQAQAVISTYNIGGGNQNVVQFAREYEQAFDWGNSGVSETYIAGEDAKSITSTLTDAQRELAYQTGRDAAKASAKAQSANRLTGRGTSTWKEGSVKGVGVAVSEVETAFAQHNSAQVKAIHILRNMAKVTGVDIVLYKSTPGKDGFLQGQVVDGVDLTDAQGAFVWKNNKIYIDINAGLDSVMDIGDVAKYSMLRTFGHEFTHFCEKWNPEEYVNFRELVFDYLTRKGENIHDLIAAKQGEGMSYEDASREVVAEAMTDILPETSFAQELAEKHQNLFQQLLAKLKEFLNDIKEYFAGLGENMDAGAAALREEVDGTVHYIEEIVKAYDKLAMQAVENYQAAQDLEAAAEAELSTEAMPVEEKVSHSMRSLAQAAGFVAVENADGSRAFMRNGEKVAKVTVEDIENSPIGAMINYSLSKKDISADDAKRQKQMFADICTMAAQTNDFSLAMAFTGSAVFTGMKANADKQYGTTYDFPSICTKTQAVIDAMSARMVQLKRGLEPHEIEKLYQDVFASGNPVPCPECYVFSRWIGIGGLLDNIYKYQQYYGKLGAEESAKVYRRMYGEVEAYAVEQGLTFGKAKGALTTKITKEYVKLLENVEKKDNQGETVKDSDRAKLASLEKMMNTVKGMTWLEKVFFLDNPMTAKTPRIRKNYAVPVEVLFDLNKGEIFATEYKEAWAFRTTQGAGYGKAITPYAEAVLGEGILVTNNTSTAIKNKAAGELKNIFLDQKGTMSKDAIKILDKARVKQKIQAFLGGQRFQSTSDARYENASDYLLAALEMQAMGGGVQVYTKVDGAVPAFSAWGFSINQSLMPLGGGLDAAGNVRDTSTGGMHPQTAFNNRDKFDTAGTITIGVNDNHIRKLFQLWNRDFIIPYHASGGKATMIAEFRRVQDKQIKKEVFVRSTDYSSTQGDKVLSDVVLRWQGKTLEEIDLIHARREARLDILTGRAHPDMDVVNGSRFLAALYEKFNGGEWNGVKVAKGKVESQIFPNEFWDQSVTYDQSQKITEDYLAYCDELGILHRFSGMVPRDGVLKPVYGYDHFGNRVQLQDLAYQYDENGNRTDAVEPFFWKVLTDRRMYDNSGNYQAQKKITLNDTTADTVTGFAKVNYGRQYDAKLALETAQQIAKKDYSQEKVSKQTRSALTADQQKNYDYNMSRTEVGSALKTLAGSTIKRYKNNVGKEVGGQIYLHRDYAEDVVPYELYQKALTILDEAHPGFEFNTIMYDAKKGTIRFDEAPDFDTAREPIAGNYVTVNLDAETTTEGYSDYIWHHKWEWVKNDYTGFDVEESWYWSRTWLNVIRKTDDKVSNRGIANGSGHGTKNWNAQLDYFGLPKDGEAVTGKTQYSLRKVKPVVSTSQNWRPAHDETWFFENGFPLYRDVPAEQRSANEQYEMEKRDGGHGTQNASTIPTYRKIFEYIKAQGSNPRILDASSGLGIGTRIGREMGLDVTDIEPYDSKTNYMYWKAVDGDENPTPGKFHPMWTDYDALQKAVENGEVEPFDVIISNAVLNVVAQDSRDALVAAMGSLLKPGGQMFINVIGKDYDGAKKATTEIQRNNKGIPVGTVLTQEGENGAGREVFVWGSNSIQKVFDRGELTSYLQDALGADYLIETPAKAWKGSKLSGTMVVLTKPEGNLDLENNGKVSYSKKGYQKVFFRENVFPPFNESQSDSHEVAERWSKDENTLAGDRRLISHHKAWYLIEAFDDMKYGYQIMRKLTAEEYKREAKFYDTITGHESIQNSTSEIDTLDSRSNRSGGARHRAYDDQPKYRGEDLTLLELGEDQTGQRHAAGNVTRSNQSSSLDRQGQDRSSVNKVSKQRRSDAAYLAAVNRGDMETAQRMVDEAVENAGYAVRGHHGTTNLFYVFDTAKSNIENDWGRGIYATTSEEDAQVNYASNDGADLTHRIERLAEMMENWDEYEDMDYEQRVEAARKQLSQGANKMLHLAYRMENPVVVERGNGGTFFTYESGYDEELDEYSEPSGTLIDVIERMKDIINEDYEWASYDADKLDNLYDEAVDFGGLSAIELQSSVSDWLVDVTDEDGNVASNEILRAALEQIGFDGIVDKSVPYKFGALSGKRYGGMRGVVEGTTHFIAFNSSQVKLTDPVTYDDDGNVIPLSERFQSQNLDIRYQKRDSQGKQLSDAQVEFFKDTKVRDERGRLLPMYHGTNTPTFTVFDPEKSDDKTSLFFTADPDVANTYTNQQDSGRDVDPYNLITENSSAEQFNAAQEKVGGGLRIVKVTSEWIRQMQKTAIKKSSALITEANKYADLLEEAGGDAFVAAAQAIRRRTGEDVPYLSYSSVRAISSTIFDSDQRTFSVKDRGMVKRLREQYEEIRNHISDAEHYAQAASIPESAVGQYTFTETNDAVPFAVSSTGVGWSGDAWTGSEQSAIIRALDRSKWANTHNLGNRYKVYLNLTNPYVLETGTDYSGVHEKVTLEYSPWREDWEITMERGEDEVQVRVTPDEFQEFIVNVFDERTLGQIEEKISAEDEAYIAEYGELDPEYVKHYIRLKNVNVNYVEPGRWNDLTFEGQEGAKTRDVAAWAKENGYDGVIFKNMKDAGGYAATKGRGGSTIAVAFSSEQVKSVDNENPTTNPDIRYQTRTNTLSDREVLEIAAMRLNLDNLTDGERSALAVFQGRLDKLRSLQIERERLGSLWHEQQFGGGERTEAPKTLNRMRILDKQIEKAMSNVLSVEDKQVLKRVLQKARAVIKEDSVEHYRGIISRRKDRSHQAEMRQKIFKVVDELNRLLVRGDKKNHVPESMKKAVAEALSAINSVDTRPEDRAARIDSQLADLYRQKVEIQRDITDENSETMAAKLLALEAEIQTLEKRKASADKMKDRLKDLRDAYEEIAKGDDPDFIYAYDEVVASAISDAVSKIGNTPLKEMSSAQLETLYDVYKMVLSAVRNANKSFVQGKNESMYSLISSTIREVKAAGGVHEMLPAATEGVRKFLWNNLKPVYAMEKIGSDTFTGAFWGLIDGEGKYARDVTEATQFVEETQKKYGYDKWDFKKKYTFESTAGTKFDLTLEQIMSLYAYSKRDQAHDHLRLGGFVFNNAIETYKDKDGKKSIRKYKVNVARSHQLSVETLSKIVENLSPEQRKFVDEMQEYLSAVMGAKGNEVSMAMYDVKLFKEKFYFPLKSAKQFMFEQNQVAGEVRIKNSSFTNKLTPGANNPVILSNFMDVWANHVHDMSMYHSFALPIEDFNRIFNGKTRQAEGVEPVAVKSTLQEAYGPEAVDYLRQLIVDLNGGARSDPRESPAKALMGKFKKAAVFASASVVIQQPSAIMRARAMIDEKYFNHINPKLISHNKLWAEVKKYAPVAVIKEMGHFDMDTGRSTVDYIKNEKTIMDKVDDVASVAPAKADEWAWVQMWVAVKKETAAKNPKLDTSSEEFLKLAGKRFTEVIVKTQVYDSTLSRSANMRSKSGLMSMATAFMAEPTTSINMLEQGAREWKKGNKKTAVRYFTAVYGSVLMNSLLVSLVYAMRDDDEDETFLEKYFGSLTTEFLEGVNPLTYYPWVKDVWSILQGFDVERSDMSLISDLVDTMAKVAKTISTDTSDMSEDELAEHSKKATESYLKLADVVGSFLGLPVKNVRRDLVAVGNTIATLKEDLRGERDNTMRAFIDELKEAFKNSIPVVSWFSTESKADRLYNAIISGNEDYRKRIEATYSSENAIKTATRKALKEGDPRITEMAEAYLDGDFDRVMDLYDEIHDEGNFVHDTIKAAYESKVNELKNKYGLTEETEFKPDTDDADSLFDSEAYFTAISNGDLQNAETVKDNMLDYMEVKDFNSKLRAVVKNHFEAGEISDSEAENILRKYGGKTADAAKADVQYWAFKLDYPDIFVEDSWFDKYYEEVAKSGVKIDMYMEYRNKVKNITGEGKKERRMAIINSLPITSAQKDALYFAEGWAQSTLHEAPWR